MSDSSPPGRPPTPFPFPPAPEDAPPLAPTADELASRPPSEKTWPGVGPILSPASPPLAPAAGPPPAPVPVAGARMTVATPVVAPRGNRPPGTRISGVTEGPHLVVRVLATLALAAFVTTFVATEVDLVRRHFPGIEPVKYWLPQVRQITLPGLGATVLCAALALGLHRLRRRAPSKGPTGTPS